MTPMVILLIMKPKTTVRGRLKCNGYQDL